MAFLCLSTVANAAVDMNISAFTDVPDPVAATHILQYQITVENSGDTPADNATLAVDIPSGTSFISVDDARCQLNNLNQKVECNFGTLDGTLFPATGSPINLVIQLRVNLAGGGGTTITATAAVSNTTAQPDSNPGNDNLSETTTITEGSDLQLNPLMASPDPVAAADTVSYTVSASNNGPNIAADAQIIFNLPMDVNYQNFSGTGWSCSASGQVVSCNSGSSIPVNAASTALVITGQVVSNTVGTLTSSATLSSSSPDGNPDNNTQTHNLTVTAGTDLALVKSINLNPVTAGSAVQFTLLATNNGPMTATNVVVSDTLPLNYTNISATGSGWNCSVSSQVVSCSRPTLAVGSSNLLIDATAPATAPAGGTTHSNSASINSDTVDPLPANNIGSVSYGFFPDGVDLSVTKVKTPSPVAILSNMTSTIIVSNNGPRDANGTIRATDTLDVNESFVSASGTGWNCSEAASIVTCDRAGPLANGASTPAITIVTQAQAAGTLQNEVCASHVNPPANETEANPANDCTTASSVASTTSADLQLTKTTSDTHIDTTENSFNYTLTVSNAGPDVASNITLTDIIPMYVAGTSFRPATGISVIASDGSVCSNGGTVICNLQDMANGAITTITITVTRPFVDGHWTNTASVFSADIGDPDRTNNTASATAVAVDAVTDVEMTAKTVTPASVRAGVEASYVLSFRNSGVSIADAVVVSDTFNPAGVGSYTFISATPTKGSCDPFAGDTLTCNIGTMGRNETQSITVKIRPDYMATPPNPRILPNTATISTATVESDLGNNSQSANLDITLASLDLIVNKSDVVDPVGFAATATPKGEIIYQITVNNLGPSFGSNISFTDTMTTHPGKNLTFSCDRASAAGPCTATTFCANQGLTFTGTQSFNCDLDVSRELASGGVYTRYLVFALNDAPDPGGDTYSNSVVVDSNEPESNSANNTATETTTVRGIVDLEVVSKIPSAATVNLAEPFTYTITVTNNGPSNSGGINASHTDDSNDSSLIDNLPAGMELTGTPGILPLVSDQGSANRVCSGVSGDTSFNCDLRTINAGSSLTIQVPVRVVSYAASLTNSATVSTHDLDTVPGNDTNSGQVNILKSSISGRVFKDLNDNGISDGAESGIAGVGLQLAGTDSYANAVLLTTTTDGNGNYIFDNLPVSDGNGYTITETTQPAGMFDGQESVAGVAIAGSKGTDVLSGIIVLSNVALSDYQFGELPAATLSGEVWYDANNDGTRDANETQNIASVSLTLSGIDDLGQPVNQTTTTTNAGSYQFTSLRPSDVNGYQLTETQPSGYLPGLAVIGNGLNQNGIADNVLSSSGFGNVISTLVVFADDDGSGFDFAELLSGSVSGSVFNDLNNNGVIESGETRIPGVTLTLSGMDYRGNIISVVANTDGHGDYLLDNLPPADTNGYTLTETQPTDYGDGQVIVGSLGGVAAVNEVSAIPLGSGDGGIDYLFAERRAMLSGYVYVDKNDNGSKDAGENGIPAVSLTLTGSDANGQAVNANATTDNQGQFQFIDIPASNASGYTLTELQPANWTDGQDTAGSAGGNVANDVISAIVLAESTDASGYLFGEMGSTLSGAVFNDSNNDGQFDSTELPIEAVTLTLTGTDDLGQAVHRTAVTAADGHYRFDGLRPGNYTLIETQPAIYVDGIVTAGSSGGTVAVNTISNISLGSGDDAIGYNFAERSAEISGQVYVDNNNNGVIDSGETAIASVLITVTGTDANGNGVNRSVVTGGNGNYRLVGLPASNAAGYSINETQPPNWQDGLDTLGNAGGSVANDSFSGVVLGNTQLASGYNFAELAASLAGKVWIDTNNDGHFDSGELPIENTTITLTGINDLGANISTTALTDNQGAYIFTGIRPGIYTVTETQPSEFQDGMTLAGNLGGTVSANIIADITIASGDVGTDYNFAERSGSLAGSVYVDSNNNGVRENTEPGIANVIITLNGIDDQGQNVAQTTQTDAQGHYIFSSLSPSNDQGYTVTETQPAIWADGIDSVGSNGGTASNDSISSIVVDLTTMATNYNFGEVGGSLSGVVFNDLNNDAIQQANEPGIPGVTLTLSGNDADDNAIVRTAITADDGQYRIADLPLPAAEGFSIIETQPADTDDGQVSPGTLGGTAGTNIISAIILPATGANGIQYNFAEISRAVANVSGRVWLDSNHNRVDDEPLNGRSGWTIQLIRRSDALDNTHFSLIATVVTDSQGRYRFEGLLPGSGYEIRFLHPENGYVYGGVVSSQPGVELAFGTIRNLTLNIDDEITDQNLPLDPSGVIYDALTRAPVPGAIISLSGPAGFDADIHLIGGTDNVQQITTASGEYQYLLLATAPAGTYTLSVTEPAGYLPGGSDLIPVCTNILTVQATPDPALIQHSVTAPAQAVTLHDADNCPTNTAGLSTAVNTTRYYLRFDLTPGVSANVVSNHIPLDPVTEGAITVVKTTPKVSASRGQLVPYAVRFTNNLNGIVAHIDLIDQIPPGFKYVKGSAQIDGLRQEPLVTGRQLKWPDKTFNPAQEIQLKLLLVVGTGVGEGDYINLAWGINNQVNRVVSNQGSARVRIIPDATFDCTDIIGKVFDDKNLNGYQDEGEPGLAGVRMASARGLLVTSDSKGRFHMACAAIANEIHGSNFILKLDDRTLPSGYRIVSENPRVIHITRGKMARINFAAALHRVVRVELSAQAFEQQSSQLTHQTTTQLKRLSNILSSRQSVLRIAYYMSDEAPELVDKRLSNFSQKLKALFKQCQCGYELIIETEKNRKPEKMPDLDQQGGLNNE